MAISDSEHNRYIFWVAYCCYIALRTSFEMFYWLFPPEEDDMKWRSDIFDYCTRVGEAEGWGEDGNPAEYFNINECQQEEYHDLIRSQFIKIFAPTFVQLYFCFVIFTHYKNASLPKTKGGCVPDNPPRRHVQLNSGVP